MTVHVAILDSVHPVLAERLSGAGHTCTLLHNAAPEELKAGLADVQVIVVRNRMLSAELLDHAPSLRVVGRVGAGLENIDRERCAARGIQVLNAPEGNRDGVGELCVAQTLVLMKHIARANAQVHQGLWAREENRGTDLFGKTVGIIGYGQMGRAFAEKLAGFGVRIVAHDKYVQGFGDERVTESALVDVLRDSDVISLHLPLTAETRHYADAAFFAQIARPVWFLNTSRGAVVHTEALLDALDEGRVTAAALDVVEFERPDLSSLDPTIGPAVQRRLLAHERVLLTPHIAGVTHEGKFKMADILATKILDAIADERS